MSARAALLALALGAAGCRIEPGGPAAGTSDTLSAAEAQHPTAPPQAPTVVPVRPTGPPAETLAVSAAGLAVPVAGVRPDELLDTFDDARSEGRVHDAIDIPAPRGTPVVAAAAGTVARLFTSDRGGLTVYVLDGRTVYYYAHLDAYATGLAEGRAVARGQALGTVGSTGNAAPENPHLHFAVWTAPSADAFWEGEAANPYPLLGGR